MIKGEHLRSEFMSLHDNLRITLNDQAKALLNDIINAKPCEEGCREFANLGPPVVRRLKQAAAASNPIERRDISRALVACLAADVVSTISSRSVTAEVIERTKRWQPRLLDFLKGDDQGDYWFPNDLFLKDYRFVTGITVPCGAQVIDLSDGIGPKTALKLATRHPTLLFRALRKPWFQIHTESRYLEEFNFDGWASFYKTAVDLLKINPHIQGIVGTSWFYDPILEKVSPRLFYLQELPLQHGAILVKQGTTQFDIKSATATSSTRRKLYEEGNYMPRCHTLIWSREAMIAWSANRQAN